MPGPEARFQKACIDTIRARGGWVVKYPAGPHGTIGTPDLLACYRSYFLAIECKAGDPALKQYTPTPMQLRQLALIGDAQGIALVLWHGGTPLGVILDGLDDNIAELAAAVGTPPAL